jgi:plasmid maintenance system antidote protein VapI
MLSPKLKLIHPGEVLEKQSITANSALRLSKFFGTSAQFWLGLQAYYDLDIARSRLGDKLKNEIVPLAA